MKLVHFYDDVLYKPVTEFDFANPPMDPKELSEKLNSSLLEHGGLGLAANQIGFPYAAFTFGAGPQVATVFNPRIVHVGDGLDDMEEGCLSFPGLKFKISRPNHIRIRLSDATGKTKTFNFTGLTARVVQHELLHLEGKAFFHGISRLKLEMAIRKARPAHNYSFTALYKMLDESTI
jgi:peptide deformylase